MKGPGEGEARICACNLRRMSECVHFSRAESAAAAVWRARDFANYRLAPALIFSLRAKFPRGDNNIDVYGLSHAIVRKVARRAYVCLRLVGSPMSRLINASALISVDHAISRRSSRRYRRINAARDRRARLSPRLVL